MSNAPVAAFDGLAEPARWISSQREEHAEEIADCDGEFRR